MLHCVKFITRGNDRFEHNTAFSLAILRLFLRLLHYYVAAITVGTTTTNCYHE